MIGDQIRKKRMAAGLSISALAEEIGLTADAVVKIENGKRGRTLEKLPKIARALNCHIDDLFPEMDGVRENTEIEIGKEGIEMLPECQICWFCSHARSKWSGTKRQRLVRYCELNAKKSLLGEKEDFSRCKRFDPNADRIVKREDELHKIIRQCRDELLYLERLNNYLEHKRRRGAEYRRIQCGYSPLYSRKAEGNKNQSQGSESIGGTHDHS